MRPTTSWLRALVWAYVLSWGRRGLSTLVAILLAAILGPREFGIVAMAMVFVSLFDMLLEQGINAAIIQHPELGPQHLSSAFWMNVVLSLVLAAVSATAGSWWASVNDVPELQSVIVALSLLLPMHGLTIVQEALVERHMDYRLLALRSTVAIVAGGAAGVALAVAGFGMWAIVCQRLVEALASLVLLWGLSDWRPRWEFSPSAAKSLLSFSSGSFLARLGGFAQLHADELLMGMFFGPTCVGIYRLALRIVSLIGEGTRGGIICTALPQFSRVQSDMKALRESVLKAVHLSAVASFVPYAIVIALSDQVLEAVGEKWTAGTMALVVAGIGALGTPITLFTVPLLLARGRAYVLAAITWATGAGTVLGVVVAGALLRGATPEVQLVSIVLVRLALFGLVLVPVAFVILAIFARIGPGTLLQRLAVPFLAAIAAGACALALSRTLFTGQPALVSVVGSGAIACILGITVLLTFDGSLRESLRGVLRSRRSAGRAAAGGAEPAQ